jgi:hypothetical protein
VVASMTVHAEAFLANDLKIAVDGPSAGRIHVRWSGKSNDRQPSKVLAPLFERIATLALENGATIAMHFESLEYLNSSTISALIGFLRRVADQNTKMTISYSDSIKWQKLCFEALRMFEKPDGLLRLEPTP